MSHKEILEEYIECKQSIKDVTERMSELQDQIKAFADVDDKFDLEMATVTYQPGRASYKHSDALVAKEKEVKEEKKIEIQNGIAEEIVGDPYLVVKFKNHG